MSKILGVFTLLTTVWAGMVAAEEQPRVAVDPELSILPSYFAVSGLTAGDVLNVRAEPTAKARDLGDLQPNQQVEVTVFDVTGTWARIGWDEGNAWVSRKYIAPVATPLMSPSEIPANMVCTGTEPFWNFTVIDGTKATFRAMDGAAETADILWNAVSSNHTLRLGLATADWRGFVQKKTCSDGMSDRLYGLQIDLMGTGAEPAMLSGCCQLAQAPTPSE